MWSLLRRFEETGEPAVGGEPASRPPPLCPLCVPVHLGSRGWGLGIDCLGASEQPGDRLLWPKLLRFFPTVRSRVSTLSGPLDASLQCQGKQFKVRSRDPQASVCFVRFFRGFNFFIVLRQLSPFPLLLSPALPTAHPTSHIQSSPHPCCPVPGSFTMCLDLTLPLLCLVTPPPPLVTVSLSLFPRLWFVVLISLYLKVRSHGTCPSPPGLFH